MSCLTKFLLFTAFLITLIQGTFTEHNNLIYTGTTKTLVLIDDWNYLNTHSMFWNQLRGKILNSLHEIINIISNEFRSRI